MDFWMKRLERPAASGLSAKLMYGISTSVDSAFRYDFNMLVEDNLTLYQKLTPKMQTELVELIFADFISIFHDFFKHTEKGWRNEFVINLHTRLFSDGDMVLSQDQLVPEVYLLIEGEVSVRMANIPGSVIHYQVGSIFGDYNILFDTPAQMNYYCDAETSDRKLGEIK